MYKYYLVENEFNRKKSPDFYDFVENNLSLTDDINSADFILVLGGDGSLLDAIQSYKKLKIPFVGIHTGSIGYYMHNIKNLNDINLFKNKLEILEFPMLDFEATDIDGNSFKCSSFADIWVERSKPQSLKYHICVNNSNTNNYCSNINSDLIVGDGILFSTPAGSTGYTKNLRGTIIPINTPIFQVVPMSSAIEKHTLKSFPLSLENDSVDVYFEHTDFRKGFLMFDGVEAKIGEENFVPLHLKVYKSDKTIKVGFLSINEFINKSYKWIL